MDIWTGSLGIAALKRVNCVRDAHVSHTMLGFGPKAKEWLSAQEAFEPPCVENSVWARLAPANAKIMYLGECVESNTYLHYIETVVDIVKKHPDIFLCDNPLCTFCRNQHDYV